MGPRIQLHIAAHLSIIFPYFFRFFQLLSDSISSACNLGLGSSVQGSKLQPTGRGHWRPLGHCSAMDSAPCKRSLKGFPQPAGGCGKRIKKHDKKTRPCSVMQHVQFISPTFRCPSSNVLSGPKRCQVTNIGKRILCWHNACNHFHTSFLSVMQLNSHKKFLGSSWQASCLQRECLPRSPSRWHATGTFDCLRPLPNQRTAGSRDCKNEDV